MPALARAKRERERERETEADRGRQRKATNRMDKRRQRTTVRENLVGLRGKEIRIDR